MYLFSPALTASPSRLPNALRRYCTTGWSRFMCSASFPFRFLRPRFLGGLSQRYPERDGMYFLPTQVAEYDRKRNTAAELRQLSLFVIDEASAIQWVRRELQQKPRSFQDLQPAFMREIQNWAKHEQTVELREILRQNCHPLRRHRTGSEPDPFLPVHELQGAAQSCQGRSGTDRQGGGPLVCARSEQADRSGKAAREVRC